MHKESAGERRSSAFQMAASVETCRGRVRVALGPRGNGFGLQERRGGEGRGRRGGRGHAGRRPCTQQSRPVLPSLPEAPPPGLQLCRRRGPHLFLSSLQTGKSSSHVNCWEHGAC